MLEIKLFGPPDIRVGGELLPKMRTRKCLWLLALLTLRANKVVERQWLSGTLWPDSSESTALGNLRKELDDVRRALGVEADRLRSPNSATLLFDLAGAQVDVIQYDENIGDHKNIDSLYVAIELYNGVLLEGCSEAWVTEERSRREQSYLTALRTLAKRAMQDGKPSFAIPLLRKSIDNDPYEESDHRELMTAYAANGEYSAAREVYHNLRRRLREELNTQPDPKTSALFNNIKIETERRAQSQASRPLDRSSKASEKLSSESKIGDSDEAPDSTKLLLEHSAQSFPNVSQDIHTRDFSRFIHQRTCKFVGREFVFRAINGFLQDPEFPSGYVLISGEPGIGKTAIMAQLVKQHEYIHHFNIATEGIRSTEDCFQNLCSQLIKKHKLPYPKLPPKSTQDAGFLCQLLEEAVDKEPTKPLVVLVDAIDEAEDLGLPIMSNCLCLPKVLPPNVYIIATTRPKYDVRLLVENRRDINLNDEGFRQSRDADVENYIHQFLEKDHEKMVVRLVEWKTNKQDFISVLCEKSDGNFMYLEHILRDIRDANLTIAAIDNIRRLPIGLREYYRQHWRLMSQKDPERFEKYYEPVVCVLATARKPMPVEQIASSTKLSLQRVRSVIRDWYEFVVRGKQDEEVYRIYHTSFQDFLREEVGLMPYQQAVIEHALDKIRGTDGKLPWESV